MKIQFSFLVFELKEKWGLKSFKTFTYHTDVVERLIGGVFIISLDLKLYTYLKYKI